MKDEDDEDLKARILAEKEADGGFDDVLHRSRRGRRNAPSIDEIKKNLDEKIAEIILKARK